MQSGYSKEILSELPVLLFSNASLRKNSDRQLITCCLRDPIIEMYGSSHKVRFTLYGRTNISGSSD